MRALLLMLCLLPVLAYAEGEPAAPTPAWGLSRLMQDMAKVHVSRGKFTERKRLAVLDVPLTSSGTLLFEAPGHLEKRTLEPREESLVLDQGVLTIENKARNLKRTLVVQQYPAVWAFVESIRSTLAGDLPTLERFYKVELKGVEAKWRLRLVPLDQRTRDMVREIVMSGGGNRVTRIEMTESNGDESVMTISGDVQ